LCCISIVSADTFYSESFGGSVTVEDSPVENIYYPSSSFGGSVTVEDSGVDNSPVLSNPLPSDDSINQSFNPELSITCNNDDGSNFDLYILTNASGSWSILDSWTNVGNNTNSMFKVNPSNMNSNGTTYFWSVNASDNYGGSNNWTNITYRFTTSFEPYKLTWHSESFGGSVEVTEPYVPGTLYYSESFGGSVEVTEPHEPEWSNWSTYWTIGQTSDSDTNMDMQVNFQDMGDIGLYYGDSGTPGWIEADTNNDGTVNFQDLGAVGLDYGNDYDP